ncbi:PilZ domain-containing protein [Salinispira pacifica]
MAQDQRRSPRFSLDVQVNYASRAIAHSKDISEGGVCLITEEPLTIGKIYTLAFRLPGDTDDMQIFGKVVWTRPASANHHENGVSFWDVHPDIRKRVTDFLRSEV